MKLLVAVDDGSALADGLRRDGEQILAVVPAAALEAAVSGGARGPEPESLVKTIAEADAVVLEISRSTVSTAVVALCDQVATRIMPLCADVAAERLAAAFGLERPVARDIDPGRLADRLRASPERAGGGSEGSSSPRIIAVWGPAGAPGRSTVAVELAVELARGGRHVGLIDADTHAPSIALALGLADEGPGFAAACRQSEFGGIDAAELTRVSVPLGRTGVDVLTG
ncbi:MAG: P-loop NTPase, partial [Microbacterium sp.]